MLVRSFGTRLSSFSGHQCLPYLRGDRIPESVLTRRTFAIIKRLRNSRSLEPYSLTYKQNDERINFIYHRPQSLLIRGFWYDEQEARRPLLFSYEVQLSNGRMGELQPYCNPLCYNCKADRHSSVGAFFGSISRTDNRPLLSGVLLSTGSRLHKIRTYDRVIVEVRWIVGVRAL